MFQRCKSESICTSSRLAGTLYDSAGNEVVSVSHTDSTYEKGAVGIWTYDYYDINYAKYIDTSGSEAPSPTMAPSSSAPTNTLAPTPEGYTTFCSESNSYEVVQGDGTYGNTYDGTSCLYETDDDNSYTSLAGDETYEKTVVRTEMVTPSSQYFTCEGLCFRVEEWPDSSSSLPDGYMCTDRAAPKTSRDEKRFR